MNLKRFAKLFLASTVIGILMIVAGLQVQAAERAPVKVTILFFNDIHGHLFPFKVKTDKGKSPVIILSHSRYQTDRDIAESVPGIQAIIGGHDQILLSPYRRIGSVDIFQAFEKGRYLGLMDLEIDPISKRVVLVASNAYIQITADINEDPVVDKIVAQYRDRVTDIMRESSSAQIALLNSGSIRASIDSGPITVEDVFKTV